jgi:hypothetical protein
MTYPSPDHHIDTHNREHYPEPTGGGGMTPTERYTKALGIKHALELHLYNTDERYRAACDIVDATFAERRDRNFHY